MLMKKAFAHMPPRAEVEYVHPKSSEALPVSFSSAFDDSV